MEDTSTSVGWMSTVNLSKGDNVHLSERSGVFFHENIVFLQEVPHGGFNFSERKFRPDFESNDDTLIPLFSDCCPEDEIEYCLVLGKVFDIDFVLIGCVEENTRVLANEFRKESLENERSVGSRFLEGKFYPGVITREDRRLDVGRLGQSSDGRRQRKRKGSWSAVLHGFRYWY